MRLLSPFYLENQASICLPSRIPTAFHPASIQFDQASPIPSIPPSGIEALSRAHSTRLPTTAALALRSRSKPFERIVPATGKERHGIWTACRLWSAMVLQCQAVQVLGGLKGTRHAQHWGNSGNASRSNQLSHRMQRGSLFVSFPSNSDRVTSYGTQAVTVNSATDHADTVQTRRRRRSTIAGLRPIFAIRPHDRKSREGVFARHVFHSVGSVGKPSKSYGISDHLDPGMGVVGPDFPTVRQNLPHPNLSRRPRKNSGGSFQELLPACRLPGLRDSPARFVRLPPPETVQPANRISDSRKGN